MFNNPHRQLERKLATCQSGRWNRLNYLLVVVINFRTLDK